MTEQIQLVELTTTEESHGSMQGIQESVPQSGANSKMLLTSDLKLISLF